MKHFLSQREHLLHEFRPQVFHLNLVKDLQMVLVRHWSDHRAAVSIWEELSEVLFDFVSILAASGRNRVVLQCFFKILL